MNDADENIARALDAYATALAQVGPSARLQARMQAAIEQELALKPKRSKYRRAGWAVAACAGFAGVATLLVLGLDARRERQAMDLPRVKAPHHARQSDAATLVFPSGAVSLWPTQATVFRVRGSLGDLGGSNVAGRSSAEQQYWIDVRVANDGSMRIERIFSADGAELFIRPGLEP
jgi:hypothetical protein